MGDLLLCLAVHARTLTPVAGGLPENFTTLLVCVDGALDACHRITPYVLRACRCTPRGFKGLSPLLSNLAACSGTPSGSKGVVALVCSSQCGSGGLAEP